jgi:hypothetical protein
MTDDTPPVIPDAMISAFEDILVERDRLIAEREEMERLKAAVQTQLELAQRDRLHAQTKSFINEIVQATLRRQHDRNK